MNDKKIAFIGTGFMGSALIRGLVKSNAVEAGSITAADPRDEILKSLAAELGVSTAKENISAIESADIVVLAVKPQVLEEVVTALRPALTKEKLIISIAAGVTLSSLASWISSEAKIIRAMPNMGAVVGEAATAISAGDRAGKEDIDTACGLFNAVGITVVVDEKLMDAVTALAGSGPAFVFLFLEAMTDAGVRCGLAKESAGALATQTLYGSAKLALKSGERPATLKDSISSPGGTTVAGLAVMEKEGFQKIIIDAVKAAMARSKELGG